MNNILRAFLIFLLLTAALPASVLSADKALTTADPEIAQEDLKLKLKPLTRSQLKIEADDWRQLLEDKASEISTAEIAVKDKLREISAAENYESALDALEDAKSKAAEATDAEAAAAVVKEAEQALEDAKAEGKAAIARVESNADTASVTEIATKLAAEKAAAEKERMQASGEPAADEAAAEGPLWRPA